jgi:hypothetical protein
LDKRRKNREENQRQSHEQLQPQEGVNNDASVPFLYKQYNNAIKMGKPQPLNTFEQKIPFFEPSTSNAMRIQRVTLPDKQQFIKTSCVSPQVECKSTS